MTESLFKRVVRPILQRAGVNVTRYTGEPDPRYPPVLRNRWLTDLGVNLVLDVGANAGQYVADIRQYGYRGKIISFEPLSSAFEQLKRTSAADGAWEVHHTAIGDSPGEATLNVAGNSTSSSLLPMMESHRSVAPESNYTGGETVQIQTLDGIGSRMIRPQDVVWLKADVQGYELAVLRGAKTLLPRVVGIECEMSLIPLYEGEELIDRVIHEIADIGFRLAMVTEAFYDHRSGRSLQLNGVFLRGETNE
jgi:FkbM family methyltransferase